MLFDILTKGAVIAVCFAVATFGGTPAVKGLIRRIDVQPPPPEGESSAVPGIARASAQLRGGMWIGLLERAALFVCVLAGFPAGIAVVLAVKSVGRYPELRTPTGSTGELFIIGTFASMLWAAAFAGLAYGIIRLW